MGVSKNRVFPQNGWFIMENHIEMDDVGGENPLFSETSTKSNPFTGRSRFRPIVENVRESFVWPLTYQWKPRLLFLAEVEWRFCRFRSVFLVGNILHTMEDFC